jgi:2-polyprenyl-6-methoxyphenol hydroxylase-like FAD-dependent oxidoreductase
MVSQAVTESVLLERLLALGGKVERPCTVTDLLQDASGASVLLEDGTELEAKYVVGADGAHSTVRRAAGIGFTGGEYEESFSLADTRLSGSVPSDEVILYFSPAGLLVVAPLPGRIHRIVATVEEAPEHPSVDFVQSLLDQRGPERARAMVEEITWGSRFHIHHRLADTYRTGRVLLAGDAAHVHSPAGGQGMNTGIQDAVELASALATALAGAGDTALDRYAATRRPIAKDVVTLTHRMTRLATTSRRLSPMRNAVLRGLGALPRVRHALAWKLSELAYR